MNTSFNPKNPGRTVINRVENGWIVSAGDDMNWMTNEGPRVQYVFTSQGALADFIKTNFRLPPKEDKP